MWPPIRNGSIACRRLPPAPEGADPARPAHLVAGDREEVAVERLHVDAHVRRRLRRVADEDRALVVRPAHERAEVGDRAERVRDEVRRDDLHVAVPRDLVETGEVDVALVVEREHPELGAVAPRDVLPRDEVRVVLELRDDDGVAGPEVVAAPRVRDEVERFRRVAHEDHLAHVGRVQQGAHLLAGAFETGGGALAEDVHRPVDVRVRGLVERRHRVEHLARLLRAVRRVEVRERLAVDLLLEDGEVRAQSAGVELLQARGQHLFMVAR